MNEKYRFTVEIYTDGACSGNPGEGGWAALLMVKDQKRIMYGYETMTTNNKMELTAVIKALSCLTVPCRVKVYSDSAYVVNAFSNGWLQNWKKNNWRNANKQEVANKDLWQSLDQLVHKHEVEFYKVKGHADDIYNNEVDKLAVRAYREKISLTFGKDVN